MKIIQVVAHFPPNLGGMQNVSKEISELLAKKGNQVEVFTSNIRCPKEKQLKSSKNIKINYLPAFEFAHTPIIPSLYKELMKIPKNSLIHVHVAQAYVPEVVYNVWKKRKIPYIAHIHLDVAPSSFIGKFILEPYKNIFLKKFLKNAEKIIVLTEDYKELIHKKYSIDKNKIIIIPNGVKSEFFTEKKKKNKIPHLLFVGRISIQKNPRLLIESVALSNSKFILDIVGDGELLEETKRLVKEKGLKNVFFHGRKEGNDLVNFYKNSDIFISPTKQESFGIVYLEAMASSLPIITSNIPAVRNVVKKNYNGLLVKQIPEVFANTIDKLIKNPKLREKLVKNGLKEVKKYSWEKIVKQIEHIYTEVLKEHARKTKKNN